LIAATGVAGVPRALCHYLGELSLSYTDLGFITHILSYRWTSAYPFPSQRKLAAQAGIGRTGIQRRICALQDLGYLEVAERYDEQNGRRTSNGYNLTPLLERLNELILRDWDTLWKHRDPLVSNGEDDETTPPRPVDSSPPGPQKSAGASRQKWAGGRSQKWVGPGRRMSVGPAPRSAPEVEAPNSDAARMESQSIEDEPVEEKHHRATTTPHVSPLVLIERAIAADSDELGDQRHLAANRTRARRLWSQTDLPADEFVRILGEARARTLEHAERVISQERTGVHLAPMLMPYYFGVVKGILRAAPHPSIWKSYAWLSGAGCGRTSRTGGWLELGSSRGIPNPAVASWASAIRRASAS
jgi:biotin operon repressor